MNRKIKQGLYISIITGLLIGMQQIAFASSPFTDINNSYAKTAIDYLYQNQIVHGTSNTTFSPNQTLTREQFAVMLVNDLHIPIYTAISPFADNIDNTQYYYSSIQALKKAGIMNGIGNNKFGVGQSITREDAIVSLINALQLKWLVEGENIQPEFSDQKTISSYAMPYVGAAQALGIVTGSDGKPSVFKNRNLGLNLRVFYPKQILNREMGAQILYNVDEKLKSDSTPPTVTIQKDGPMSNDIFTVQSNKPLFDVWAKQDGGYNGPYSLDFGNDNTVSIKAQADVPIGTKVKLLFIDQAVNISESIAMYDNGWALYQDDGTKPIIDLITYTPGTKNTCTVTVGNPNHSILFNTTEYNDPFYAEVGIYNLHKPNQPTIARKSMDHIVDVYLGTDANGNSIATANDVIQAVKQSTEVNSFMDAKLGAGSDGTWIVQESGTHEMKGDSPAFIKIHFSKDMDMLMAGGAWKYEAIPLDASNIAFGTKMLGNRAIGKWDDPRTFDIDPDTFEVVSGDTLTKTTVTDVFGHTVDMEHSNLTIK